MKELEERLHAARLAAPSPELDRRVEELFATARPAPANPVMSTRWWWLAAAVVAGGAAALIAISTHPSPPTPPVRVVYRIEAQGEMRAMLLGSAPASDGLSTMAFHLKGS